MLYELIDEIVEELARYIVSGRFHIGLDAVKEYLLFYVMADRIQKGKQEGKISIWKYYEQHTSFPEELKNLPPEKIEKFKYNRYERLLYLFNTLNAENRMKHRLRQKQEAEYRKKKKENNQKTTGNPNRFKGVDIFPYQIGEFSALDEIKEGKGVNKKASTTLKRIISEKGYLKRIRFKDFKEFIEYLKTKIDQSGDEYKNVQYYKLEKRLGFELIKAAAVALKQCRENGYPLPIAARDLIEVFHLPFISDRQKYVLVYPYLDEEKRMIWRGEVEGIMRFLGYSAVLVLQEIEGKEDVYDESDWERFRNIYAPSSFKNDYKLRKDFTLDDFRILMETLDEYNTSRSEQEQKNDDEIDDLDTIFEIDDLDDIEEINDLVDIEERDDLIEEIDDLDELEEIEK